MGVALAEILVILVEIYLALGLIFAVFFVLRGVGRVDPVAREGTRGFRLIIGPGVSALWPLLLVRWLRGAESPREERNAHRAAARARAQEPPA